MGGDPKTNARQIGLASLRQSLADTGKAGGARIALGLDTVLGSRAAGRFGILYYHRLADPPRHLAPPTLNVTPSTFRVQVAGLLDRGFRFISVGSALARIEAGKRPLPRSAVITFDDGFRGVYEHAWPVLRTFDVPATLFIATAYMDSDRPFPFDRWGVEHSRSVPADAWAPLTWAQCREMVDSGLVEIGSHTHTHTDLRHRPDDFRRDLATSLDMIRERLEISTSLLSFPFGNVRKGFANEDLVAAAEQLGVRCGLTTTMQLVEPGASPFRWGRFEGVGSDTAATLAAKLDGWYAWMDAGRRMFRSVVG